MLQSGDVIGGRYRLVEPLASGGMGTVWRAAHMELDVDVALKLMLSENGIDPSGEKRFRREAQAAARLRSPHVVHVHDFGVFEGQPYLAMELLHGEDLQSCLERGPLPLERCADILDGVAKALDLAHEGGVIHRDIKPANIFLAKDGEAEVVKVLDFGVAKVQSQGQGGAASSTTGSGVVGSPAYMSPEQVWCEPVTSATDLWSMAVVAFEMATGKNPFDAGPLVKVFEKIVRDDLPRLRDHGLAHASLDAFFERALTREVERRFASGAELARAFRAALDAPKKVDPNARTLAPGATDVDERPRARRPPSLVLGLGVVILGGAAWFVAIRSRGASEAEETSVAPRGTTEMRPAASAEPAPELHPTSTGARALSASATAVAATRATPTPAAAVGSRPPIAAAPTSTALPVTPSTTSPAPVDPDFGIPRDRP